MGGKSCGWENGHGMQGQEETKEAEGFFQVSWLCCETDMQLNGSCVSLCLLNKQAVPRPSVSLEVTHINKIFFNRSFVIGAGAYVVNSKVDLVHV